MVGTTTSVRDSAAMPAEKSIRGSACGVTSNVASQFTSVTANWLVASRESTMTERQNFTVHSGGMAFAARPAVEAPVMTAIAPR